MGSDRMMADSDNEEADSSNDALQKGAKIAYHSHIGY